MSAGQVFISFKRFVWRVSGLNLIKRKFIKKVDSFFSLDRLTFNTSRGALSLASRRINPKDPATWEFTAFSQNGEDGIVDYCLQFLKKPDRDFVEIGASDARENNTSYLAFVKKYTGIMIDGNKTLIDYAKKNYQHLNYGVSYQSKMIDQENITQVMKIFPSLNPDFFSLDIDGIDLYVAKSLLDNGFRPKFVCVEYNSLFGNSLAVSIPYIKEFNRRKAHYSAEYYGVSLKGWTQLWESYGYKFISNDTKGVNGFYYLPEAFVEGAFDQVQPNDFMHNFTINKGILKKLEKEIQQMPIVEVKNLISTKVN